MQGRLHGDPTLGQGSRIDRSGGVVVPAVIRKALGISPGQMLHISVVEGIVRLRTVEAGPGRKWAIAERSCKSGENVVDDLIAERRAEAAKE